MLAQKKLKLENHKDENSSKTATLHDTNDTLTRKTGPKARKLVSSCRSETTVLLHHVLQRRFCCTTVWQFVMCVCVCVCLCVCAASSSSGISPSLPPPLISLPLFHLSLLISFANPNTTVGY